MSDPKRILIVDDDSANIKVERRVLELAGYQVFAGENAAQALELARSQRPDLILLDMNLGDESGLDVCRLIKDDAELGGIYVVILSATATESESQAIGLEQGADGYIARPISNRELTARVASLLRIKDTEDALRASEAQARALLAQAQQSRRALLSTLEDQKRAEESLRESEARFKATTSHPDLTLAQADLDLRYTWIRNPHPDFDPHAVIGRRDDEMDDNEGTRQLVQLKREVIETGKSLRREISFPVSGGPRTYTFAAEPLRDDAGNVTGVATAALDITVRKQAEERFASAFNASPTGIAISAIEDGRVVDVNPGFLRMFGFTREEVIGRTSLELNFWANPSERGKIVEAVRRDGYARNLEIQVRAKSGEIRDALVSIELITLENEKCMLSVVHDVTDLRRAEQEARLLQTIALGVSGARDLDETIQNILRLVCEATNWSVGEAWIPGADGSRLERHPAWHNREPGMEKFHAASAAFTFAPGVGLPGRVWQSRKPVWVEDVTQDPNFPRAELAEQIGLKAGISVPVLANDHVTLVLEFFLREARPQDPRLIELISAVAAELGVVVERKQAEEQIRFQANLVASVSEAIIATDMQFNTLSWNAAAEAIYGWKESEVVGKPLREFLQTEFVDDTREASAQRVTEQGSWTGEVVQSSRDGARIPILSSVTVYKDSEGNPIGVVAVNRDIRERKRAEESLQKLSRAVEQTADMVFITDSDGIIEYVNPAFERLTGYTMQDARGNTPRILKSGLQDPTYYVKLWQTIKAGEVFRAEAINRRKNGELYFIEQTITPVRDEAGNVTHFVSNCKDVTARKQAEESQRRHNEELEAISKISSALRVAQTLDEMLPLLLDETLAALGCEAGIIRLFDPNAGKLRGIVARGWFESLLTAPIAPGEGIGGKVFTEGRAYISREFFNDPQFARSMLKGIPPGWGGICVPLCSAAETVGVLFVSVQLPREITAEETSLLVSLSEMAGTAIHRLRLHEETRCRLERLQAVQAIDRAITGSLDLRLTLDILLKQAQLRLGVDAAAVLLADSHKLRLEFAAGQGFRSSAIERSSVRMGDGHAGRAAFERRVVHIPNLSENTEKFVRDKLLAGEGFVFYAAAPLLVKGQLKGTLEVFRRAPLSPDSDWMEFLTTLAGQAAIAIDNIELFNGLNRSNFELSQAYDATIEGWSRAMDLRDEETEGHTRRVTDLTLKLARAFGIPEVEIVHIRRGALLHDMGKMGVPDSILLKPGRLTDEEWAIMKKHPQFAYDMLSPIDYLKPALDIPWCHHEKWDGSGYPRGLKGEEIPLSARLFAIVDVWDALTSDRPYRPAWTLDNTAAHIREQSGKHFDPKVVDIFLQMMKDAPDNGIEKLKG